MLDLKTPIAAIEADAIALESSFLGKAKVAATVWPYWTPVVILAALLGHFV